MKVIKRFFSSLLNIIFSIAIIPLGIAGGILAFLLLCEFISDIF